MKAMILAAGRGERMRPLTDNCPKPLLKVKGVPLIEYHIKNLVATGVKKIVINHAWLGEQLVDYLGDGERYSVNISYSKELIALETAGGILKALPLLAEHGEDAFIVVNGDVYCQYNFQHLPELLPDDDAHLMLVNNPEHNRQGDFQIVEGRLTNPSNTEQDTYTFSGIALYRRRFFEQYVNVLHNENSEQYEVQPLAPMLRVAASQGKISASLIHSAWTDVGTPERLAKLNRD